MKRFSLETSFRSSYVLTTTSFWPGDEHERDLRIQVMQRTYLQFEAGKFRHTGWQGGCKSVEVVLCRER